MSGSGCLQGAKHAPLAPATMLWLIQRDFLEGKTVQAMVKEALEQVPNPNHDSDIDQVASQEPGLLLNMLLILLEAWYA